MSDKVSIIILSYDNTKYLMNCLFSIDQTNKYENYEVIVVNQGCDRTRDVLAGMQEIMPKLRAINLDTNIGFSSGNNLGAKNADKDNKFYYFLNDDTRLMEDSAQTMVDCLHSDEKFGCCGLPAFEYIRKRRIQGVGGWVRRRLDECYGNWFMVDGKRISCGKYWSDSYSIRQCQKCGKDIDVKSIEELIDFQCACGWNPNKELYVSCDYIGGGCLMINKELFDKIGGFDTMYDPLYWEDVNLAFTIKELGFKAIHINKSGFYHAVSITSKKDPKFWKINYENHEKFVNTYGKMIDEGKI